MNKPSLKGRPLSGFSRALRLEGALRWIGSQMLAQVHLRVTGGPLRQKFAELMGANDRHISLLQAVPNFMQMTQMLAPLLIERLHRHKPLVLLTTALGYGVWFIIAVIPWFTPPPWRPWAMIALIGLGTVFAAVQAPARQSWLTDLIPHGLRGRFLGSMNMAMGLIGLVVQPAAGWGTDRLPESWGLPLIFAIAVALALLGVWYLSRVPEPLKSLSTPQPLLPFLSLPLRHRDFRRLILFFACRSAAVIIGGTYFNWYLIHVMKLSMLKVTLLTSYQQALTLVTYPLWGHLVDRFGSYRVLAVAAFGNALFPLPWLFMTPENAVVILLFGYVITGLSNPGLALSQQNYLMRVAPTRNRSVYFGAFAAIVQVSNACGALFSGQIAAMLEGTKRSVLGLALDHYQMLFLLSLLARLSCMFLLLPLRHAERRAGGLK